MPRRSKPKVQKRDWRWYASFGLNAAVALSMVLGTVFLFTGGSILQRQAPPPTLDLSSTAVQTPTVAATPASAPSAMNTATPAPSEPPLTPTPKALSSNASPASTGGN